MLLAARRREEQRNLDKDKEAKKGTTQKPDPGKNSGSKTEDKIKEQQKLRQQRMMEVEERRQQNEKERLKRQLEQVKY